MATKPKSASAAQAPAPVTESDEVTAIVAVTTDAPIVPAGVAVESIEIPVPAGVAMESVGTPVPAKQHMEKAMKTAEDFVAFGQGNVDAFVKCSQIWSAGVQDLSKQAAATTQARFDETMSVFKAMTEVKSLKDVFELHGSLAKTTLEKAMSETGKLTDASLKLTEQALAPIAARVTLAVETFGKAA